MSTKSYSNVWTVDKQIEYLGRRLDKYAKFYWRGEDMWETYHTFIVNNGSALKFVNGPSFSNEYSSPQYDHAMGNLTGVKFTRMQVSFSICTYGVTAAEYRRLVSALGPYEVDYLAFDYDDKLCYLAKTTGMKEATKTVVGQDSDGNDLFMVENNITFEVQGEQCALAQRQYVWVPTGVVTTNTYDMTTTISAEMLSSSELSFGVVSELSVTVDTTSATHTLDLYISADNTLTNANKLCTIEFNQITENWQNTEVVNGSSTPSSLQSIDQSLSFKYDSASGLVFMQYGESDYKILDLLLTNTYGSYLVKDMKTAKMKISSNENIGNIHFIWSLNGFNPILDANQNIDPSTMRVYGRAKAILV